MRANESPLCNDGNLQIFFTKNGMYLGVAHRLQTLVVLAPCVGLDRSGQKVTGFFRPPLNFAAPGINFAEPGRGKRERRETRAKRKGEEGRGEKIAREEETEIETHSKRESV